jgi:hypothetical protein
MRSVSQKPIAHALAFLGQSGKVTKETPQGTDGPLTPFERHLFARNTLYLAFSKKQRFGANQVSSLLLFLLPPRSKI